MPTITNASGYTAGVTSDNRLMVEAVMRDYGEANALEQGWSFVCQDDTVTPTGAADVFCRIANLSADPLVITKIRMYAASTEIVSVQTTANYTSATSHTDKTAQNRLAGSANLFITKGTFESDVDITGDSGSVELCRMNLLTGANDYELDLSGGSQIVIPNGYSLLLKAITGAVAVGYQVFCHFAVQPRTDV